MGNTCLGAPRKGTAIMKKITPPQKRYASTRSKNPDKNYESIAGQSQGNRLKINKSLLSCSICMQNYNITVRQPVIACQNNHTYCLECILSASKYNQKCPECRSALRAPVRNRDIYQLVEDNVQKLQDNKLQIIKEDEKQIFVNITVDRDNQFLNNFWIEGDRIMKIEDDRIWEGIVSAQVLPKDKESVFSLRVVVSQFNNIEVGIVGKGYKMEKNVTCKEAVVYHLADGMILCGVKGRKSQWKQNGQKISVGQAVSIQVKINPVESKVSWWSGEDKLGEANFSDYLRNHQFVAYVLMCRKEDVIELNA